jgi:hypothetical protein
VLISIGFCYFVFLPATYFHAEQTADFGLIVGLLGYGAAVVGVFFSNSVARRSYVSRAVKVKYGQLILSCMGVIFLGVSVLNTAKGIGGGLAQQSYHKLFIVENYDNLYWQIPTRFLAEFEFFSLGAFVGISRLRYATVLVVGLLEGILSPTRMVLIRILVVWGIYGALMGIFKITKKKIIFVVSVCPALFLFLLVKRGMIGVHFNGLFDLLSKTFFHLGQLNWLALKHNALAALECFDSYAYFLEILKNGDVEWGYVIFRTPALFVSRSIWPDKPEAIQRVLAAKYNPEAYRNWGGVVATILGDGYFNGGLLGVSLECFALGAGLQMLWIFAKSRRPKAGECYGVFRAAFYASAVFFVMQFFRGFFSDMLWQFAVFLLASALAWVALDKRDDRAAAG